MIRRYRAAEAAAILAVDVHMLKCFRECGFLHSTKSGHGYVYDSEELESFIRMTRGFDLSNEYAIRLAAQILKPHKKAVCGNHTASS